MSLFFSVSAPEELQEAKLKVAAEEVWAIVLYNDDVNTFDWVIECLVKYCGHDEIQAEQCAWFVHTKGKYPVKKGVIEDLLPVCSALCDNGLSATIEK